MECHDIQKRLSLYLDSLLSLEEKTLFDQHLRSCQKCFESLNELRKTIEHMKNLEEVEPPAWLTQKIMAKVKEEALPKKGLLHRLFYPLHIKLPLEAFAMIAIAVITVYIFKTMPGEIKFVKTPDELPGPQISSEGEVHSRKDVDRDMYSEGKKSRSPALQRGKTPEKIGEDSSLSDEASVPLSEFRYAKKPPPHKGEEQGIEERKDVFQAQPSGEPAPPREPETIGNRYFSEYDVAKEEQEKAGRLEAPAPVIARDKIETFADSAEVGEADRETPLTAYRAKPLDQKKEVLPNYTVSVQNMHTALNEIERAVLAHKGDIVKKETYRDKAFYTITLRAEQVVKFLEKLATLGEIKQKPHISPGLDNIVTLNVEIIEFSE